ncbi:MAG: lipid-A-disaccharide synthase [Acetobacteraceae bacterium]|nr:lipid-A-disaccharide synthase [Acetobacteraceae bacterium]
MPLIYLIAGEQSGDELGARLIGAIRQRQPGVTFAGIGGTAMANAGFESLFPLRDLALMGFMEVLPKLFQLKARLRQTVADIEARRPDVVVTIDSPGFSLRVLRAVAPLGIPRAHYVAPQVWGWKESRVKHYPGLWDRLLCLLPFEPAFFARHNLPATFVGHPVLESGFDTGDAARFRSRHDLRPEDRILIVMPGSRRIEIARHLPLFRATLDRLASHSGGRLIPVMPLAEPVKDAVTAATRTWTPRPILVEDAQEKRDAFAAAAAGLTKSGTATLELAVAGVPMVVTYRIHPITALIVLAVVKVPYFSILNLLSNREIVPELLQTNATPDKLAAALRVILEPEGAAAQRQAFAAPLAMLCPPDGAPSDAAAAAILELLK